MEEGVPAVFDVLNIGHLNCTVPALPRIQKILAGPFFPPFWDFVNCLPHGLFSPSLTYIWAPHPSCPYHITSPNFFALFEFRRCSDFLVESPGDLNLNPKFHKLLNNYYGNNLLSLCWGNRALQKGLLMRNSRPQVISPLPHIQDLLCSHRATVKSATFVVDMISWFFVSPFLFFFRGLLEEQDLILIVPNIEQNKKFLKPKSLNIFNST